jgi:hypothetical protein
MTGTALTVGLAVAPRTAGQIPTVVFDNISFLALPAAPAGLSASAGGPVVNLAWSPVADAATYAVKRASTPGGSYTIIAAAVAAPSYADASAPLDATAYYVVTASNLVGEGPVSAEVSAIPRTPLQLWRLAAFGTTAATGPAADLADPDGDGLPNLLEYAFGTSPTSAASVTSPVVSLSAAPNAKLQITFLRARSDLTYAVEASSDLAPGSWTVLATNPGSVSPTVSVTVTDTIAPTPRRFLRLRVTAP